ncbi:MAG: Txe/YoeB family addiction module toxin [Tetragenococcus koreensis]|nr:Txe/YoeB family addiction module toxin [Tetragenococcus koreensis]MDN6641210.1 Txe/YoeB family addiction module toxin [Tetragenococcus sp.]
MGYSIKLAKSATKDLKNLKSAHLDKKFKELMVFLQNNPFQNPLPYEKLIGNLKDKYSRRLNIQHRIVYSVDNNTKEIIIWSAWAHYER